MSQIIIQNVGKVTKNSILQAIAKDLPEAAADASWNCIFSPKINVKANEITKNKFDIEFSSEHFNQTSLERFLNERL
jgi:hypothetical protein